MTKPLISLLYVSRATHCPPDGVDPVPAIVNASMARNPALGVTGALLYTGLHFAHLLEGPAASVEELMDSIRTDPRHAEIDIVQTIFIDVRSFDGWSLAYAGRSSFMEAQVEALFQAGSHVQRQRDAARLVEIMTRFVQDDPGSR